MLKKRGLAVLLTASLLTGNIAVAGFGDALVGGVVGGVVGSVITNEIYNKKRSRNRVYRERTYKKRTYKKRYVAPKPVLTTEKKIQKSLTALGFYRGAIDGQVNSYETRAAIRKMNQAYEMGDTSSLSPRAKDSLIYLGDLFTFDRIFASTDNRKRAKGKKIQAALKIHGFYHTKIDGAVGSGTRRSIADYKASKGLSHGNRLDFEEEYQLINSGQKMNSKNIDDTIASLKGNSSSQSVGSGNSAGTVVLQPAE